MYNAFAAELLNKIAVARAEAHRTKNDIILPEHLLFALTLGGGHLSTILQEHGVTPDAVRSRLTTAPGASRRLISAIRLSGELNALFTAASESSYLDPLNQVTIEHVVKALMEQDTIYSIVPMLQDLNIDIERLRKRTKINTELMDRTVINEQARAFKESTILPDDRGLSWQSLLANHCYFDNEAAAIIEDAWIFSQIVGPPAPKPRNKRQVAESPQYHKHCEFGIHHLLTAFRKLCPLPDYVRQIFAIVDDQNLTEMLIGANLDHSIKLRDDAKNALLIAHSTANRTTNGLITPMMLIYGMVNQFDSILYTNCDLEQLGRVSQHIRRQLANCLEKADKPFEFETYVSANPAKSRLHDSDAGDLTPIGLAEIDHQIGQSSGSEAPLIKTVEERLSRRSRIVVEHAIFESKKFGYSKISVETLLLGLLYETFGPTSEVFSLLDLNLFDSCEILSTKCRRRSSRTAAFRPFSANAMRLMERAWEFTQMFKMNRIEPEHIVLAIAEEEQGVASFVCEALALRGSVLRIEIIEAINKFKKCGVPL